MVLTPFAPLRTLSINGTTLFNEQFSKQKDNCLQTPTLIASKRQRDLSAVERLGFRTLKKNLSTLKSNWQIDHQLSRCLSLNSRLRFLVSRRGRNCRPWKT